MSAQRRPGGWTHAAMRERARLDQVRQIIFTLGCPAGHRLDVSAEPRETAFCPVCHRVMLLVQIRAMRARSRATLYIPTEVHACPDCGEPIRALPHGWSCPHCGWLRIRLPEVPTGVLWAQDGIPWGALAERHSHRVAWGYREEEIRSHLSERSR